MQQDNAKETNKYAQKLKSRLCCNNVLHTKDWKDVQDMQLQK
jgi:hypothetical protein